ncbi:MAG: Uma2 family endonuclease, partial [Actinobacteria bacterium]|nr:Uma2 family endonuclease [Actinomycetota bacterium]
RLFARTYGDIATLSPQNPIHLGRRSEPQPDVALLHQKPDDYASAIPAARDIFLVVEVAETSADPDRRVKVPLYARAGILEVWLVDLQQQTITAYQEPSSGGYRTVRVLRRGEQIAPAAFPDRSVAVADILPD